VARKSSTSSPGVEPISSATARVELGEGELLYTRAEVMREARALESPTIVFMVGGLPGKPYEE
jgi:hypothetical protein